jgi:CRISPR-associated endonuclease/helicase Cas3
VSQKPLWSLLGERLEQKLGTFAITPDMPETKQKIYCLRREISDACKDFAQNKAGISRLYVPTGGGKTYASLRYALSFAERNDCRHIFYIIPYLTIIDQNARDCREALDCGDNVLLEFHSNIVSDKNSGRDACGEAPSEPADFAAERFDAPIIFTTLVQFLDSLFSNSSHAARRMQALCNSVIIIDEVQTVPVKCTYMFNMAVRFLRAVCNCSIVLCTATQPELEAVRYPLRFSPPRDIVTDTSAVFHAFNRTRVIDKTDPAMDIETLARFVHGLLDARSSVLIIVNTKKAARALYRSLKEYGTPVYHLSTNMCAEHRLRHLDQIKTELGRRPLICVSTQLIEAGVDISFDCVIRSLAGLDSVAQAAGRCNRHGETAVREVYIVKLHEHIENLRDIERGSHAAALVLHDYNAAPGRYENNRLSPALISWYYRRYYEIQETGMGYIVPKGSPAASEVLFDLLGRNSKYAELARVSSGHEMDPYLLTQAFQSAGKAFCAIDRDTIGVIVPFDEGKEIITALCSSAPLGEKFRRLKEAQRYTVNLYRSDLKKYPSKAFHLIEDLNVLVLNEGFYSPETGITEESQTEFDAV